MSIVNRLVFLVLLISAVLASRYFYFGGSSNVRNNKTKITEERISEVSINFHNKSLSFRKGDYHWVGIQDDIVLENVGAKFDSLLSALVDLDQSVYKTDKLESFAEFGVDGLSSVSVKILSDIKPVEVVIGNFDPVQHGTYFRYAGSELVFFTKQNIRSLLSGNLTDYRYAVLPEVILPNLASIQYYWNGQLGFGYNFSIEQWCSQKDNFEIDRYFFEEYLFDINNLRSSIFDRQTIDHKKAINRGSIVFNYEKQKQPKSIHFLEMPGQTKIFYLFDSLAKNNYLLVDSSAFFGKIWVNPATFIKNN